MKVTRGEIKFNTGWILFKLDYLRYLSSCLVINQAKIKVR